MTGKLEESPSLFSIILYALIVRLARLVRGRNKGPERLSVMLFTVPCALRKLAEQRSTCEYRVRCTDGFIMANKDMNLI